MLGFKVRAFTLGGAVAGLGGALYAHYGGHVAPEGFAPLLAIDIVLALTVGGVGSVPEAVLGAVLVIALLEGKRFMAGAVPGVAPVQRATIREPAVAIALLPLLRFRPRGVIPERTRTKASRS